MLKERELERRIRATFSQVRWAQGRLWHEKQRRLLLQQLVDEQHELLISRKEHTTRAWQLHARLYGGDSLWSEWTDIFESYPREHKRTVVLQQLYAQYLTREMQRKQCVLLFPGGAERWVMDVESYMRLEPQLVYGHSDAPTWPTGLCTTFAFRRGASVRQETGLFAVRLLSDCTGVVYDGGVCSQRNQCLMSLSPSEQYRCVLPANPPENPLKASLWVQAARWYVSEMWSPFLCDTPMNLTTCAVEDPRNAHLFVGGTEYEPVWDVQSIFEDDGLSFYQRSRYRGQSAFEAYQLMEKAFPWWQSRADVQADLGAVPSLDWLQEKLGSAPNPMSSVPEDPPNSYSRNQTRTM